MASHFTKIIDITNGIENFLIKACVIRLWRVPGISNNSQTNSIELILMDDEGVKILATIRRNLVSKLGPLLIEGKMYTLRNFDVDYSTGEFRPTPHAHRLFFQNNTMVKESSDNFLTSYGLNCISFGGVNNMSDREADCLIDIISYVSYSHPVYSGVRNGKKYKRITIDLQDIERNKLQCTLWNNYCDEYTDYVLAHPGDQIFLALQFVKVKKWNNIPSLGSSYFVTRLFINDNIPEIIEFKKSFLLGVDGPNAQSSSHEIKIKQEFDISSKKKIADLFDIREVSDHVIIGEIESYDETRGWWYNGCGKHLNKLEKFEIDSETKFWCKLCNDYTVDIVPWIKVAANVQDVSGIATFTIFEREILPFIGKSALFFREQQVKEGDCNSMPKDFRSLIGKKILFKVKITNYNLEKNSKVYTVSNMTNDEQTMRPFIAENKSEKIESSSDVSETIPNPKKRPLQALDDKECEIIDLAELTTCKMKKIVEVKIEKND